MSLFQNPPSASCQVCVDVPLNELTAKPDAFLSNRETYVICRLGNDSQIAASSLREARQGIVKDVIGGLRAWARHVDPSFPVY